MHEGRFEFELRFETIFNIVDSYSEAQKKFKKAEVTSNLDDSDEELKKRVPKKIEGSLHQQKIHPMGKPLEKQ